MAVPKLLRLLLAFFLIKLVAATSFTGCSTTNNPTCGEVWTSCRTLHEEQYCRDLLCETWRPLCDDCDICHNTSQTSFPTPTFTYMTSSSFASAAAAPQGGCDGPKCAKVFSSCYSTLQWCRDLVCETYSVFCGNCPICFDKSTTTFPPAESTTSSSSTLSTVTLPTGSITITAGNLVWPTSSPAEPTVFRKIKRDSPEDYNRESVPNKRSPFPQEILGDDKDKMECGYGCNQNSCAQICMTAEYVEAYKHYPHTIWVPESTSTSPFTITLATSQFCSEWSCSTSGCKCDNKSKMKKRAVQKRGECWELCDNDGHNCSVVCSADPKGLYHADVEKRGDCFEVCTPGSNDHHSPIVCTGDKLQLQKRQCQQYCSATNHHCLSACSDDPNEACFEVCDKVGNYETECSMIGQIEKRQCRQTCDKDAKNCITDCKTDPKETCFEVCDKVGKCATECSLIGEAEKRGN